jgi:MerR family copper efflux transcriptional regulator
MMISAFARQSGLSADTVRFYVRRGLLHPTVGQKGGSRPYQMFSAADLEQARVIRTWQVLGLSLDEISAVLEKQAHHAMAPSEFVALLTDQRDRLKRKTADLQKLIAFLDAKIEWVSTPDVAISPKFPLGIHG